MSRFAVRPAAAALALAVALTAVAAPREAAADPAQLCRAGMNLMLFPFDIGLAPMIAAKDEYYGLTEIDDEVLIQIGAAVPGYIYLTGVQMGGGVIRAVAGLIEVLPGIATFFREGTTGAQFRSQDETWQMYSTDFGPCPFRFGSSYNTINEG